jgi:hypothetical protein
MKTGLIIFGAFLVTLSIVLLIGDEIVNQITPAPRGTPRYFRQKLLVIGFAGFGFLGYGIYG